MRIGRGPRHGRRWDRRIGWATGGLALAALMIAALVVAVTSRGGAPADLPADVAAVDRGPVAVRIATTGAVAPAEAYSLGFAVAGTVVGIEVRPGDMVRAGQKLASVDDADIRQRRDDAQDALDEAEKALDEAQAAAAAGGTCPVGAGSAAGSVVTASLETVGLETVGLTVIGRAAAAARSGAAGPTPTPTPAPTAPATAAPTQPANPSGTASPSRTATSPEPGGTRATGDPRDGCAGRSGGGDPLHAAEQRLTQARTQLAELTDQLTGTVITAPITGKVLSIGGNVGSRASAGGAFIQLGDVNAMQVTADFPEADAGRLAAGQRATVTLSDRVGKEFDATVLQVDPMGTTSGSMVTFGTRLAFAEPPEDLLVGQSASVLVTVDAVDAVLRVPATAVHDLVSAAPADGSTARASGTVLVHVGAGTERRSVLVGLRGDQYVEISSGLAEGETVHTAW